MADWYWMKNGEKHGPVDTAHLKQLALTGQLQPTDTIWREGLPNWVPASKAKGLEFGHSQELHYATQRNPFTGPAAAEPSVPVGQGSVPAQTDERSPFHGVDNSFEDMDDTTKPCPFCAEPIAKAAVKCKHCGEFLTTAEQSNRSMDSVPTSNSVQQLGDGRFAFNGAYDWGFKIAQQAMSECKVKIKEADPARGVINGKCSYGINPFGITVNAAFHTSGDQTILELSANLIDSFDTFGACKKKIRQISERLLEIGRGMASSRAVVPNAAAASSTQHASPRPPSYSARSGPSHRGKAVTGFCLSLGGLLVGPVAIVGVIMSGVALTNMSTSNNEQGKGFAIAGLIVGFLALLGWLMILFA